MNKTKKNRKNNKTFRNRKLKKGGMENDDNDDYYPSYIEEKEKEISQRKDRTFRCERKRNKKAQKKIIDDVTRKFKELDIPSYKRTYDETRGDYMHHFTRKSPKKTLKGGFNAEKWFKNVLSDSVGPFYEEAIFDRDFQLLSPDEKQAVDEYLKKLKPEEHDKLMKDLKNKIKQNDKEIKRIKEYFSRNGFSPTENYK
jgi:hypothetical protein